jgi:hypothetical protein
MENKLLHIESAERYTCIHHMQIATKLKLRDFDDGEIEVISFAISLLIVGTILFVVMLRHFCL